MTSGKAHDTAGLDSVALTLRLNPVAHAQLQIVAEQTGKSLNRLINEAVEFAMTPGGVARIARSRRRLKPRPDQVQAAMACIWSYLGRAADAQRTWPWGRFPGSGGADDLATAAGYLALEIDVPQKGRTPWVTSGRSVPVTLARPSGNAR